MAVASPFVVPAASPALDELLALICDELQITAARHKDAEDRYHKIAEWLDAEDSPLRRFSPTIYPQGSMAIGTTVKPVGRIEHDLDMVCEFRADLSFLKDAMFVLNSLEARLKAHHQYKLMLKRKKRCVTVEYANEFHLDILPAKPDAAAGAECVVVPDRKLECWMPSNPRGFAQWFLGRAALRIGYATDKAAAAAAPIPSQERTENKAVLKLAVQLWKRWRDVRYGTSSQAPRSIILTTLAGLHYGGEQSVVEALILILARVSASIPTTGRLVVQNPMNRDEDFSESWNDASTYRAFLDGLRELQDQLLALLPLRGPELAKALERLFGDYVKPAYDKHTERISAARQNHTLKVGALGALTTSAAGIAVKPNTFFGE